MEMKAFLEKPKHQNSVPQRKNMFECPIRKRVEIIMEPKFVPFNGRTLILRKMVELKAFLAKPKHQNHAYQWEECVYCAQSTKKWILLQVSKFA